MVLFPSIVCLILLYVFLQQDSSSEEDTFTITTIPQEQNEEVVENEATTNATIEQPKIEEIMVDVKGAVKSPGVYILTADDRIIDAIDRAGGYTEEAHSTAVNHAQKLQDEMFIYIPKIGEEIDQENSIGQVVVSSTAESSSSQGTKIDLNSTDEAALTTLPGIGPSKAQAILAFREENGSFKTIDDLKNVTGIGEKTFEKLKEFIVVK
ncbi:helix-hairpin-helix domain-containing protein [Ureibacillus chungkukjangi]|uniref:helix-hairpin-helix domain-containing protein n=1 Tax=Ureibacillus chungkukjangi TaxID=1202712 RepID=UPI00203C017E|nr:helix-hairpin-helix domain-containing protein [Ureibacillus chungkukjangi]MCM3388000.1 helix-hairpin-helix domain-containing protein [Ureibacillus chungkukjangi]